MGQDLDAPISDPEIAKTISKQVALSFYQLIYPRGNPIPGKPLIVKLIGSTKQKEDFIVIVHLPDDRIGVLSSSQSEIAPIPFYTLPITIKADIQNSPSVNLE